MHLQNYAFVEVEVPATYYLEYLEVFKQANLVVYYACLSDIEHYVSFKWLLLRNGIVLAL